MNNRKTRPVIREKLRKLVTVAIDLDELKNRLPEGPERVKLAGFVEALHDIAEALDAQYGFGLYLPDEPSVQEAA